MDRQLAPLRARLADQSPAQIAARAAARPVESGLELAYWDRDVRVVWPAVEAFRLPDREPLSTFDAAMVVYYLHRADGTPLSGRWIGFRDLPDGAFYHQAFQGYGGDRLASAYGADPERFREAARRAGGQPLSALSDYAFAYSPLPRVAVAAVLWPGDEDFPTQASILFDAAASHYMITDGLALLGSGLVKRILAA